MTCTKVDTGRHNLRCPNSEQQSYLNSNNTTFPTYTWSSDAAARLGIPFREKDWYGIPFREKVWYGIPFRKKPYNLYWKVGENTEFKYPRVLGTPRLLLAHS